MNILTAVLAFALASCVQPSASKLTDKLDSAIVMPEGASDLKTYDRFYAKDKDGWEGVFISAKNNSGRASFVEFSKLPLVFDGGCSVVNVRSDENQKLVHAFCNGVG